MCVWRQTRYSTLLAGLEKEAIELHEGFLEAWREFGWLPEMFDLHLRQLSPYDGG
jgi:hypothetical protein